MSQVSVANMFTAAKRGRSRTKQSKPVAETPEIKAPATEAEALPGTKRSLRGKGSVSSEMTEIPLAVLSLPSRTRSSRSKTPENPPAIAEVPAKARSSRNKTPEIPPVVVAVPVKTKSARNKTTEVSPVPTVAPTKTRSSRNRPADLSPAVLDVPTTRKSSRSKTPEIVVDPPKSRSMKSKPQAKNAEIEVMIEPMDSVDDASMNDSVDSIISQFENIEIKETIKQLHPSPKLVPSRTTRRWSQDKVDAEQNNKNDSRSSKSSKPPISCPPMDHEVEIVTVQTIVTAITQAEELSRKMTPVEVKEKLSKVGKLSDLKEALTGITAASSRSTRRKKTKEAKEAKEAKEKQEQAKETIEKEASPSYQRFHTLSQAVDGSLPLPYSYKLLEEVFRCTDTVVSMLHNRREMISLEKIKNAVQEMMKKDYKETFLKQIKHLFPAAYIFFWEKEIGKFGARKNDYELHVDANTDYRVDMMEGRPLDNIVKTFAKMGPMVMVERRRIAENSIINSVKKQHLDFCSNLNPPIVVDETKLLKWHRDFDVDACPPIPESEFPKKPDVEKLLTASEILLKAEELFNLNPRMSEALVKVADTVEEGGKVVAPPKEVEKVVEAPKEVKEDPVPKHLKGLNPKLIEKIKAKEAEKARKTAKTDPGALKKLDRYRRLPGLARIIRNIFISEQKAALPIQFVCKKTSENHSGSVSVADIEEDVKELVKVVAPWPTLHNVRDIVYLKINNNIDINNVVAKLEQFKLLAEQGKLNN